MPSLDFRPALPDDAEWLAERVNEVSAGVASLLLRGLLPGLGVETLLTMILRDAGSHYSHRNCVLAEVDGRPAGLLFAYAAARQGLPALVEHTVPARRLEPLRELLTVKIPGSLYINTLWVDETVRGMGLGYALMDYAAVWAADSGLHALSLFAWKDNARAVDFYTKRGFCPVRALDAPDALRERHPLGGHVYVLPLDANADMSSAARGEVGAP